MSCCNLRLLIETFRGTHLTFHIFPRNPDIGDKKIHKTSSSGLHLVSSRCADDFERCIFILQSPLLEASSTQVIAALRLYHAATLALNVLFCDSKNMIASLLFCMYLSYPQMSTESAPTLKGSLISISKSVSERNVCSAC